MDTRDPLALKLNNIASRLGLTERIGEHASTEASQIWLMACILDELDELAEAPHVNAKLEGDEAV